MKPILNEAGIFDANFEHVLTFVWNGKQFFAIKLIIKDYHTGEIVYTDTKNTTLALYALPAKALTNGKRYIAGVSVVTPDGESDVSDYILIRCYSTPIFRFSQITPENGTVTVRVDYIQEEGEKLAGYQIELYDNNKNLIERSPTKYSTIESYNFEGLASQKTYYVRAFGKTLNGGNLDTDMVSFETDFEAPYIYANTKLENLGWEGIRITSDIHALNGIYNGHLLSFDPVKGVNLTDGASVVFKTGFNIDNDFVLKIECYPIINKKLLQIKGDSGEIDLYLRMGSSNGTTNDSIFAELNSRSATTYTLLSEYILKPNIDDLVFVYIKKEGHMFDLNLRNKGAN